MLRGRFAPSPTGPLHMGSLTTALASYLDISVRGGSWHIRIDDLDPPREDLLAKDQILTALTAHGLIAQSSIDYQSHHSARYEAAIAKLQGETYFCGCSRAQLKGFSVYPGHCREQGHGPLDAALRLRISSDAPLTLEDEHALTETIIPALDIGDSIVRRRDKLWAYNFATAVDDGHDFSHVLRGQDLMHTTALQVIIMARLGLTPPTYTHIPLLYFANGQKLSKHTHAPALNNALAADNLAAAFYYLGCHPPAEPAWGVARWLEWGMTIWPNHVIPEKLPIYPLKPA